jgi:mono/diheme cytochrome c family protein
MTIKTIKLAFVTLIILPLGMFFAIRGNMAVSAVTISRDDLAVTYKAKCAMCHTQKAEKYFDPEKADAELIETILKGKKGEKPPYMPGFESKGMTEEEAGALTTYMRTLRTPAE